MRKTICFYLRDQQLDTKKDFCKYAYSPSLVFIRFGIKSLGFDWARDGEDLHLRTRQHNGVHVVSLSSKGVLPSQPGYQAVWVTIHCGTHPWNCLFTPLIQPTPVTITAFDSKTKCQQEYLGSHAAGKGDNEHG